MNQLSNDIEPMVKEIDDIIRSNCEQIALLVNLRFEECRAYLRGRVLAHIKKFLTPLPAHFVWERGSCPYDSSGELKRDGNVSLDQTISQFLEEEYSGSSEATYISGCGLNWNSWGDELHYETNEIGYTVMKEVLLSYLEEKMHRPVSEKDLCYVDTDPVYDLCYASDFFFYEAAIDFLGIGDMLLSSLFKNKQQ